MLSGKAFSQCNNNIELKRVSSESNNQKSGVIEVEINTAKEYVCFLNIEKGTGPEKIQEKKGAGKGIVRFEALDRNAIYQVLFEFTGEEKPFCKKLQKSQITFE